MKKRAKDLNGKWVVGEYLREYDTDFEVWVDWMITADGFALINPATLEDYEDNQTKH